jgi:large subunit ribosomal protein L4
MELTVYNHCETKSKELCLSSFDVKEIRYDIIHQAIVWQLCSVRAPIAHTKQISDVRGSTRKIYKQKGTGNARHGSNRRVQFRGGAVVFGPTATRNFTTKINKKQKKIALRHAFVHMLRNKFIVCFDKLVVPTCKTKDFLKIYSTIKGKKSLFIDTFFEKNFKLASRNVTALKMITSSGLNVKDILTSEIIIMSEAAVNNIMERLI